MRLKSLIISFIIPFWALSCMPDAGNKVLTYQNIIILSDLSDRIEPTINRATINQQYPPKDIDEIKKILEYFKDECVKPGKKIGDKSRISFSTFSSENIASIDIDQIKELGAKQQFINSTGNFKDKGLKYEIDIFTQNVEYAYNNIRNKGLDLISIVIDKIENKDMLKENKILTNGIDTTFINYDNHIYIFTDGYLEYIGKKTNSQFYFGDKEIEKIRNYCNRKKIDIKTALTNKTFCLPPVKNNKNQLISLHILETHERDKDTKLQRYKNPKGLRDNEILEEVWRKWAVESGFKSFEWKKY